MGLISAHGISGRSLEVWVLDRDSLLTRRMLTALLSLLSGTWCKLLAVISVFCLPFFLIVEKYFFFHNPFKSSFFKLEKPPML